MVLARYLLQQLTDGQPDRALNETHFEFRGGAEVPATETRRRAAD